MTLMTGQRLKNFSNRPSICAGVTLIVFGVIAIAAEIVRKAFTKYDGSCDYYRHSYVYCRLWHLSTGIWCGVAFFVFGLYAIITGTLQRKRLVITHGVFSILTIGFATALIVLSGVNIGLSFDGGLTHAKGPYEKVYFTCNDFGYYDRGGREWAWDATTPDFNGRRWDQRTPDYWKQGYWGRTTSDWRSWLWGEGRSTTSDRSWIPGIYRRTTPSYYWGDGFRAKSTLDSSWRNWYQGFTTKGYWNPWFQNDQTTSRWRPWVEKNQYATTPVSLLKSWQFPRDENNDKFLGNEIKHYPEFPADRKKRESSMELCYMMVLNVDWLIQLIMSCLMVFIGIVALILSIMTTTTACLPFCCPPSIAQDQNAERAVFRDTSRSLVFDINGQVPKPETGILVDSIHNQLSAMEVVNAVTADDVPLLMDGSDSEILHV